MKVSAQVHGSPGTYSQAFGMYRHCIEISTVVYKLRWILCHVHTRPQISIREYGASLTLQSRSDYRGPNKKLHRPSLTRCHWEQEDPETYV